MSETICEACKTWLANRALAVGCAGVNLTETRDKLARVDPVADEREYRRLFCRYKDDLAELRRLNVLLADYVFETGNGIQTCSHRGAFR